MYDITVKESILLYTLECMIRIQSVAVDKDEITYLPRM